MSDYLACTGNVADSISFVSEYCNCVNQNRNNHFIFGNKYGIQFEPTVTDSTTGSYSIPSSSLFYAKKGCASVSGINGDLLFCSDAKRIYDRTFNIMENGDSIMGNKASTQAAIILPKSVIDSTYYLISVEDEVVSPGQQTIWWNVINMSLDGANGGTSNFPNGEVTIKNEPLA